MSGRRRTEELDVDSKLSYSKHLIRLACVLTRDGVGEAVRVFGNECVLDVPPAYSVST